jgi:transcriptional regulator with XRE-family HTH domain
VTPFADQDLSPDHSRAVAARVREELARRRISRQRLADDARISISTLEKALASRRPFTLATLVRLEQALGVTLRVKEATNTHSRDLAPDSLGAYARAAVTWLEGEYLTLRPSFDEPGAIYAYRTVIRWDETASCLAFQETERLDAAFVQHGFVSLPNQSGHVYLMTNEQGQFRLAVLARPTIQGELYGILTTLQAGSGSQLTPVSTPLALVPARHAPDPVYGRIRPEHPAHAGYEAHVAGVQKRGFARLYTG